MKEYIKTLTYGLKDLKKTRETYKNYKTEEFNSLMNRVVLIDTHFKYLQEGIENNFYTGDRKYFFEFSNLKDKVDVRFLKTNINHACQEINQNFIESIVSRPNRNKIRCFTIRFYLKFYTKINKIMHNTLEDMIERSESYGI